MRTVFGAAFDVPFLVVFFAPALACDVVFAFETFVWVALALAALLVLLVLLLPVLLLLVLALLVLALLVLVLLVLVLERDELFLRALLRWLAEREALLPEVVSVFLVAAAFNSRSLSNPTSPYEHDTTP